RLVLRGLPDGMRSTSAVLTRLADAGVSVDMVAHADRPDGRRQLQLSVKADVLPEAREPRNAMVAELGGGGLDVQAQLVRAALGGAGLHGRPGVHGRAFQVLLDQGIEVHGLSTSAISIALLFDTEHEERAVRALHDAFGLGEARS